jgi:phosphoribosylformimino-5-aminoimidazole carboxamide ribotide isomerase
MELPQVLPVLDLKGGLVVRGVAGRRSEYRPIQSLIAPSAAPDAVAGALVERFGFSEAYVADLDAIGGDLPDWVSYERIAAAGLRLWLDAGIGDTAQLRRLLDHRRLAGTLVRVIIGLESLARPDIVPELVRTCGAERLVFSLDLKAGVPLGSAAWQHWSPQQIVTKAVECGINSIILLDLAQVGTYQGVGTGELCRALRQRYPQLQLIGGGGLRSRDDLQRLAGAGFDIVLVASALHDGRITKADLAD